LTPLDPESEREPNPTGDGNGDGAVGSDSIRRADKPLGRGLDDVSHLFLSAKPAEAAATDHSVPRSVERLTPLAASRGGVALLRPAALGRDRLPALVAEFAGALEDGLRTIDTNIPCHPCGEIDVLAVSRGGHVTIVDVDATANDALLARGLAHFHWVVRNMPNLRRMYREPAINFSLQPRLVLLAPQFSALLRSLTRQLSGPQVQWVRYHAVESAGGPAVLFEPVTGD
jgi:hypothetical protein